MSEQKERALASAADKTTDDKDFEADIDDNVVDDDEEEEDAEEEVDKCTPANKSDTNANGGMQLALSCGSR
jgi:hypothetical protein